MSPTTRYTSLNRSSSALRRAACLAATALAFGVPAAAHASPADGVSHDSAGASSGAVASSANGVARSGHRVYFRSVLQGTAFPPRYRPGTIRFGERSAITGIRWSRWSGTAAGGRGVLQFNNCQPDCATARPHFYFVRIKLSRVRQCGSGRYEFTRFAFRYLEGPPAGVPSRYAELHPC